MLIKRLTATLLSCCLALPAPGLATVAPARAPVGDTLAAFDRLIVQAREMRAAIDDSLFDLDALVERLDADPDRIMAFVREQIRFEPYAGLLRAAEGTLQSRAGNTLDQSVLLARLLNDAGVDARIVQGKLTDAQARNLVRTLAGTTTPAPPPPGSGSTFQQAFQPLLKTLPPPERQQLLGQPVSLADTTVWPAMENGAAYLTGHLNPAGIRPEPALAEAALVRHSLDYYWVQYRDAAHQPWVSVHTLPQADALEQDGLEIAQVLDGEIPAALQHRLRIALKLERRLGGRSETIALMTPWERPVANMAGRRINVTILPDALDGLDAMRQPATLAEQTEFMIPMLNGQPAPGAQVFDFDGQVISLDALSMDGIGAAALFKQLASNTADAADALAGLSFSGPAASTPPRSRQLTRVWLEYTSLNPDGTERVDERTIWHHDESPTDVHPLWPLSREHAISVNVGQYSPAYLMARSLDALLSQEALLRHALAGKDGQAPPKLVESLLELDTFRYFDLGALAGLDQQVVYRAEPSLLVSRQGMDLRANGESVIRLDMDVVHNRRVALSTASTPLRSDPALAMRIGVWETLVEQVMVLMQPGASTAGLEPFPSRVFLQPAPGKAPLILPDAAALAAVPTDALPAASRRAVAEDLSRGFVVALDRPTTPGPSPVWWRIDPGSGETLGRGYDGRGATLKEYLTMQDVAITALLGGAGAFSAWGACHVNQGSNHCSNVGCIATGAAYGLGLAVVSMFITGVLSVALGVDAGIATGATMFYFETGVNLVSNTTDLLPTCLF